MLGVTKIMQTNEKYIGALPDIKPIRNCQNIMFHN